MARAKFTRDSAGIEAILKSAPFAQAVRSEADAIAAQILGVDVVVDSYETDRAAASVTIRDPRGLMMQINDGVLTRAAAARGLEVTEGGRVWYTTRAGRRRRATLAQVRAWTRGGRAP